MTEIASCALIQGEADRQTAAYMAMFKTYPDVVSVQHLQEMLGRPAKQDSIGSGRPQLQDSQAVCCGVSHRAGLNLLRHPCKLFRAVLH